MIVELDLRGAEGGARLLGPDDFKAFTVVVIEEAPSLAERVAALGIPRLDEHAWVPVSTLRSLAGAAATPEWEEALASMIDYARSKGWMDDELDAIRGHVERADGQ